MKIDSRGLDEFYSRYGPVLSAKACIDANYTPVGYGFVSFQES